MPALMVQGCTSWAGKSWLAAALCRWFARRGVRVAPFKAQNMSNNARVVDGGEIGVAQWLQARACGIEPDVRMNPVLVKPEREGSQVVRLGRVDPQLSATPWSQRGDTLWHTASRALDELLAEHELVVIEGAGSPAEINLADSDIVNMRTAAHAGAPVLLVADIDRGGAFAHLYGTWRLVGDEHRGRIAGFVLNRFRGDASLLPPGPQRLEELTGVPTVGVVPMIDHDLPDEDGAALHRRHRPGTGRRVAVVRYPTASNLDELTALEQVAQLAWVRGPEQLERADLVVLPGSKHVSADLGWLEDSGIAEELMRLAAAGTPVLGICGGMQMLGSRLVDDAGVDGSADGLGLLGLTTTFSAGKHTARYHGCFAGRLPGFWEPLAGRDVQGYEIRHGHTVGDGTDIEALADGRGWVRDNVLGIAVHGVLEDPAVLEALFGRTPDRTLDDTFELLADTVERHLDTELIVRLAGTTGATPTGAIPTGATPTGSTPQVGAT